jgi:hypothetical protein
MFYSFMCNMPGTPPAANHGDFDVEPSMGAFTQYNGTSGLIANLNEGGGARRRPLNVRDFIPFDLNNAENITLTAAIPYRRTASGSRIAPQCRRSGRR